MRLRWLFALYAARDVGMVVHDTRSAVAARRADDMPGAPHDLYRRHLRSAAGRPDIGRPRRHDTGLLQRIQSGPTDVRRFRRAGNARLHAGRFV